MTQGPIVGWGSRGILVITVCTLVSSSCGDGSSNSTPTTPSTSITTTTSILAITTTSTIFDYRTTTTTSMPRGDECECVVTFAVTNAETLGALQYDTSYAGVAGGFSGEGSGVNCTRLAGDFAAFNDVEAERRLSSAFISAAGITGPIDIAQCNYSGSFPIPKPSDFPVAVVDQSRPDFGAANATVAVREVDCSICGGGSTTTTSTTLAGGDAYTIAFDLSDAVTVGALQFQVDYSGADGNFQGKGYDASCSSPLAAEGGVASFNDVDSSDLLVVAAVSLAGFTGPTTVIECTFVARGAAPEPADFAIQVVDAAAPDLVPISPFPVVSVSVIAPD